jgi:phage terminase large subunit GpA-like protein
MLAGGEWRATAAGDGRTHGYHISALYAPVGWPSWSELQRDRKEAERSKETMQVFVNTVLGLPWKDVDATPITADLLMQRREVYPAEVPQGGFLMTAGVDTQDDRLECELCAWGADEQCWSIGFFILHGDPAQPGLWAELDEILNGQWHHESGFKLAVAAACIDSGGHHSAAVYEFCRTRLARKIWAMKGGSGFTRPIFPRHMSKGFNKAPLYLIGVDAAKEKVYSRLRIERPDSPGFCHFPMHYNREYFVQLVAEQLTTKYVAGRAERVWVRPRDTRNEALDCRVANVAALHGLYQHGVRLADLAEHFEKMQRPHTDQKPAVSRSKFIYG